MYPPHMCLPRGPGELNPVLPLVHLAQDCLTGGNSPRFLQLCYLEMLFWGGAGDGGLKSEPFCIQFSTAEYWCFFQTNPQ